MYLYNWRLVYFQYQTITSTVGTFNLKHTLIYFSNDFFVLLQGTDITVQELRPLIPAHIMNALQLEPERSINVNLYLLICHSIHYVLLPRTLDISPLILNKE